MNLLKSLGNGSSFGDDELDAVTLKVVAPHIYIPLNHIINLSFSGSCFANKWRIGRLIPLFKGKRLDRTLASSYRPISLLPLVAKITERAAQQQILKYMEESKQLNYNNNAYRKFDNSTTAVLQISDALYEAAELNTIADIIMIDKSAAFDCISHEILNQKLHLYNFGTGTRKWVTEYLNFIAQYVSIGSKKSMMKPVLSGVPQGSILGPLLFTIYVNELPSVLNDPLNCEDDIHGNLPTELYPRNCKKCGIVPAFADDATIVISSNSRPDNQTKLEKSLDSMNDILTANKLTMKKTTLLEVMIPKKRVKAKGSPPFLDTIDETGETKDNFCKNPPKNTWFQPPEQLLNAGSYSHRRK